MKLFFLVAALALQFTAPTSHAEDRESSPNGSPTSRAKIFELEADDAEDIFYKLLEARIKGLSYGKGFELDGELTCDKGIRQTDGDLKISQSTCSLKIGGGFASFDSIEAQLLSGKLAKQFPAEAPFEGETYRKITLNLRVSADEGWKKKRVSVSYKAERNVVLLCKSSDSNRWAVSVKFSDKVDSASVSGFIKEGNPPSIPEEISAQPGLSVQRQERDGLKLLDIDLKWKNALLSVKQHKRQFTYDTYGRLDGTLRIGSEEKKVSCDLTKND